MNRKSLGKNAIFNAIRSLIAVLFPIITYSYAARVVGVETIGRVNYVASIIEYFSLAAVFGVATYAVRECAAVRDDRASVDELASGLWTYNILTTLTALILLALVTFVYSKLHSYVPIILVQCLSIIFTTMGADWINVVYEDYSYIMIRGVIINVLNLILLLAFVHSPSDYLIYAFLNISTVVFSGIANLFYIRRYVTLRPRLSLQVRDLTRKLLPFFINEFSIAIYVGADVIILGSMKGDYHVGIYSTAVKIYTIVKGIFIAIFSVTLSRLSEHAARGERDRFKDILSGVISVFVILGLPAMTGMILYARPIVLVIGGADYEQSAYSLALLAIALLFAIFGGIVTNCIDVPLGYERVNSRATLLAAAENTLLNIPFIYFLNEIGAAITTIIAELTVLGICTINVIRSEKWLKGVTVVRDIRDSLAAIVPVVAAFIVINRFVTGPLTELILGVAVSVILYFGVLIILKNRIVMEGIGRVRSKLHPNR